MSQTIHKSRDEIAAAYDSAPWWYDLRGLGILTFAYNSNLLHQLRFFAPRMGARHLEVACGTGTLLELFMYWRWLTRLPPVHIVGIDYAEPMLNGARQRFAKKPSVELRHADAAALPFDAASFDTVNIANALHCFPDIQGVLGDVFRVLKPGGSLVANVLVPPRGIWPFKQIARAINTWGVKKGILYAPCQQDDIRRRLLDAGFQVVFEGSSGNCYDVIARKPA